MLKSATKSKPALKRASYPEMAQPVFPMWLLAILLALVTMVLYWPATSHGFISLDDPEFVLNNTHVNSGLSWQNALWALGSGDTANWHPVTWLSHMLDCQMFGVEPWGHHLTSVLLHALNAMLVFVLLRLMTGMTWRSLWVAALFSLHPLRVESVAWVAERKDVLSGCFGLLSLIFYARYVIGDRKPEPRGWGPISPLPSAISYLLSLFFFTLGLMSKPMLVTWPFVMLLLDYWPLRRIADCRLRTAEAELGDRVKVGTLPWRKVVWEKIPFFVPAAAASVATLVMQRREGALAAGDHLSLGARGGNALISCCRYLGKLLWPTDLAVFYPHPGQWPIGNILLAGGLILGFSALLFSQRRRYPFLLIGWLWFLGTLVPVIGLVQVGAQAMADRYTYIPSLGILILGVWGGCDLIRRWRHGGTVLLVSGIVAIVLCFLLTRQQLMHWKDDETLFRHAAEVVENNYLAHNNLGIALNSKGQIEEAISQFQTAIRLKPDYAEGYYNLGIALNSEGQIDQAISQFQTVLSMKPDYAETHNSLGIALGSKGQIDEAIIQFQTAIRLKPDYAEAYYNLGIALNSKGQIDQAISQFQQAIRVRPDYAEAHNNLGIALYQQGRTDEAVNQFREALRLKPDDSGIRKNLESVLPTK
jgi:protein O-mannosyl-transferase